MIEELREKTLQAFLSLPKRGTEIGGLLLGRKEGNTVRIDTVEEIACEHRFGPSFVCSDADREGLQKRLEQRLEGALEVVGFFRSYTSREAELDESDQRLMQSFFPDGGSVLLLLRPLSGMACEASFVFPDEAGWPLRSAYPPVPFEVGQFQRTEAPAASSVHVPPLPTLPPTMEAPVAPPQPIEAQAPEVERAMREVPPPRFTLPHRRAAEAERATIWERKLPERPVPTPAEKRPHRQRVWLPLATCVLAAIAAASLYELWTVMGAARWSDLKLDAKQTPHGLALSWDPTAAAVLLSSRGVLMVDDGGTRRELELSKEQVKGGAFTYQPVHPDVLFRLQIYGGSRASGDSLRVLAAAPPASPTERAAAPQPAASAAAPAAPPPEPAPARKGEAARAAPVSETMAAPDAVHQVQPQISDGIRSRIESPITVPVEVVIDSSGRVVRATARGNGDGLYRYLAREATKAARGWRFARVKSKGHSARRTITFVFRPAGA